VGGLPGFVGPVSYRGIVPMKISEIIRLLEQDGWVLSILKQAGL
jgi:hypothetical protein